MALGPLKLLKRPVVLPASGHEVLKPLHALERAYGLAHLKAGKDSPEGSHRSIMRRDDIVLVFELKDLLEGLSHAEVGGNSALEGDRAYEVLAFSNGGLEVSRDRVAEPGHDVVVGGSYLLEVYHVAFGEDRAPSGDPWRVFGLQGQVPEIFYRKVHPACLLVEERACAGGANGVHLEIRHPEIAVFALRGEEDELGVLSAHLYYRPRLRMEDRGRLGLSYDLVGKAGAYERGYELTAGAGGGHEPDIGFSVFFDQFCEDSEGCLEGFAFGPGVMFFEQVFVLIKYYRIGAY